MTTFLDERGRVRCTECTSRWGDAKLVYLTETEARSAARAAADRGTYLRPYPGGGCGYWHLSSSPGRPEVTPPRPAPSPAETGRRSRVPAWLIVVGLVLVAWLVILATREALVDQTRPGEPVGHPAPRHRPCRAAFRGDSRCRAGRWDPCANLAHARSSGSRAESSVDARVRGPRISDAAEPRSSSSPNQTGRRHPRVGGDEKVATVTGATEASAHTCSATVFDASPAPCATPSVRERTWYACSSRSASVRVIPRPILRHEPPRLRRTVAARRAVRRL